MQSFHRFKIPSNFRVKKSKSGKESDKNIVAPEKSSSTSLNPAPIKPQDNPASDSSTMIVEVPFEEPHENNISHLPENLLEDDEGRLEQRIAAPWDKDVDDSIGASPDLEGKKLSRLEERKKRKSLKIRPKEKIGKIDIDVLQKELSKYLCTFN